MQQVTVFCPGHVTGLFHVPPQPDDLLSQGSLGAGFSIDRGVRTTVSIEKGEGIEVYIGGTEAEDPQLSVQTVAAFARAAGGLPEGKVVVRHEPEVPVGAGLGTSGAAAVGIALGLNALVGGKLSEEEVYQVAHKAEILAQTGLGTVLGLYAGGCKVSVTMGAPGRGEARTIEAPETIRVVIGVAGPFPTQTALQDEGVRARVEEAGRALHAALAAEPTFERFLDLSREFSRRVDLFSPAVRPLAEACAKEGIHHAMLMFGDGLYSLVEEARAPEVEALYRRLLPGATIFVCSITRERGKVV
ncbi:pantoate kinase [Spirochaeta thermophila]|uniref:Predicted kinase n=1 Tax=Winmispira thermophila (strain ATCC 49972 / DSM 6192 / RI 19.B1) TaxID=665571 RepID=E0RNR8_WINT6|nr:GHMP kinase [Spirochaeta thermophila]ADN01191.1 predicted kinase [Spirochaeta thermophila DSM 6192]